jgi:PE-PPE domain-containing protein
MLAFARLGDSNCVHRMSRGGPVAGKHRKISRPAAVVGMVVAPAGLAAAAIAAGSLSPNVVASTRSEAAPPPSVDLLALITPANSTAQIFAGTTYYGTDYTTVYGTQQVVPFFQGPPGIADAIVQHKNDTDPNGQPDPTGVVASGWGAGQTGTALANMSDSDKSNVAFVILDNNTNRAGGGFWTTYAPFAPLLGTSADPTPSDTGAPTLDVAYEYNINSNAPVDPLNPFALGNSLAAYVYGYGAQSTAVIPQSVMDEAQNTDPNAKHYSYVIDTQGKIISKSKDPVPGTTTYVTIQQDNLPLTRPLRLLPGGDIIADAIDPTMTELVDTGYNDGKGTVYDPAIPKDPSVTRPMQPGSSLSALGGVPGSVQDGLEAGVDTAQDDVSNPTNFITKPLNEASKLPIISSLNPSTLTNSSVSSNTLNASDPNKFAPVLPGLGNNSSKSGLSTTGGTGLKNFTEQVKDAVSKVTGGLTGDSNQ